MRWRRVDDAGRYVREVLAAEADDIPSGLIDRGRWCQVDGFALVDLTVDEAMVAGHDADATHRHRRDRFVEQMLAGEPIPPLIALGADRFLVDGYARLRAVRLLGESHASVLLQSADPPPAAHV